MKIAVAQLIVSEDKQKNLETALHYIAEAKKNLADLIVLPETFMAFMSTGAKKNYADIAEPLDGPFVTTLSQAAKQHQIHVVCGIYEQKVDEENRCYNTIIILDDEGKLIHKYQKTHLYDAFSYNESKNIIPSDNGFEPVKTKFGMIGVLVCYEMRFPEITRTLALKGAEIILVPTAWVAGPMKEEHILSMSKGRAIENTVFMCVADQVGNIYAGRSVIYNPMGVVLASRGEDEGLIYADIDINQVHNIRKKLPCLSQRRPELYELN